MWLSANYATKNTLLWHPPTMTYCKAIDKCVTVVCEEKGINAPIYAQTNPIKLLNITLTYKFI